MSDRVLVNAPASRSPRSVWIVNESKTITHRSIVGFKLIPPTPGPNDDVFIRYEQIQPHIRPDRHESSLQEFHYITGDWEYIGNRHDCAFALNLCRRVAQIVMPDHGGLQTNAVISNTYHAIVKRMKKLFVQTDVQYHATVAKSIGGRLSIMNLERDWCQLRCDVCVHSNGTLVHFSPTRNPLEFDMLLCARCDLMVHRQCYRHHQPFVQLAAKFVCEQCRIDQKAIPCVFCGHRGGLMSNVELSGGGISLVHPVCSVATYQGRWGHLCLVCKKPGGLCVNCSSATLCNKWFHPRCAQLSYANRPQGRATHFEVRASHPNDPNRRVIVLCDEHHPRCVQRINVFQPGFVAFAIYQTRLRILDGFFSQQLNAQSDDTSRHILSYWKQKKIGVRCDQLISKRLIDEHRTNNQQRSMDRTDVKKCTSVVELLSRRKQNLPPAMRSAVQRAGWGFGIPVRPQLDRNQRGQHHQQPEVIVLRSPTIRPEICKRPTITQEQRSKLAQTVHLLELMMHREQVEMRRLALVGLMYEEKCRIEREKECEFAERGMRLRSSSVIGEISRIVTPYIEFDGFNALAEKYRRKRMGKRFNGLVENHIDAKIPRNEYGNETKPHSSKVTCTGWTYLPVFLVQPSDPSDVFSADELLLIRRMSETTSDSKSVNTVAEDIKFF